MADPETLFGVDLSSIRDRLALLDYFTGIHDIQAGSEAMAGLRPFIPPAAFVSISAETYEPNRYAAGAHGQRATPIISVLCALPAARADDALGDEVEQARKVVLAQLNGWTPDGAGKALEARRYSIRSVDAGLVWFEWLFATSFQLISSSG
jgi:hypothetical protein